MRDHKGYRVRKARPAHPENRARPARTAALEHWDQPVRPVMTALPEIQVRQGFRAQAAPRDRPVHRAQLVQKDPPVHPVQWDHRGLPEHRDRRATSERQALKGRPARSVTACLCTSLKRPESRLPAVTRCSPTTSCSLSQSRTRPTSSWPTC